MDVVVLLILPIALTVAWVSVRIQTRKVTHWFFIHAISACLGCLLLACLLNQLHPPGSGSLEDSLGNSVFWIPFLNAVTGFFWALALAAATTMIAGMKGVLGLGRDARPRDTSHRRRSSPGQ